MTSTNTTSARKAAVTRALSGLDLPDCFAAATVAAEARLLAVAPAKRTDAQKRDLRRIAAKASRLEGAL